MSPEEAEIIRDIFERVRQMGPAPRDPEAQAALEHELRANPDAVMGLVRAVVALDRERAALLDENDALRRDLEKARHGAGRPPGGGLFGGAGPFAGRGPDPRANRTATPDPASPWTRGREQGSLGSTLAHGALGGAIGLAGGLFGYEILKNLFGGDANQDEGGDRLGGGDTTAATEQHASNSSFETGGSMDDPGDLMDGIDDSLFS